MFCAVSCAAALFFLQYRYDNKYRTSGAYGKEGVLDLSGADLSGADLSGADPSRGNGFELLSILTYGWELYPQELINPGGFGERRPVYTYLGQYGGFETGDQKNSPHGFATYRLKILLPPGEAEYALELPEIYTASRVWVNGLPVSSLGNVNEINGRPSVRTGMITFHADGLAELVVQAADYSHYYSGMIYPPAFGSVRAVSDLLSFRFLRTCVMVAAAFTVGIMYFLIGLKIKEERDRMILFSFVCFSFALYVCYPLFHLFGAGFWSYRLEDASFYLFLTAAAALQCSLCGIKGKKRGLAVLSCALFAVGSLAVPVLFLNHSLNAMLLYSTLTDGFKLLLFSWLIVTALFNREEGETMSGPLLAGLCVIAAALLFQEAAPIFEPVRFGWQTENAGFLFILLLAGGLWFDTVKAYAGRAALSENIRLMKKQFEFQEENYRVITGNFEEMRRMRHDLRHHLHTIKELTAQKQYQDLEDYVNKYEEQAEQAVRPALCENHAANAVLNYYTRLADQKAIPVSLKISLPADIALPGWQLGVLLGNLLENAIEASEKLPPDARMITVYAGLTEGNLLITVKNNWDGQFSASASGERIVSTKHEGDGIGLSSVRSLVEKSGGQFYLTPGKKEFEVSVVLWNQRGA